MFKILITGYNGFVGSNLIRELKDCRICGVDIVKSDAVSEHYAWEDIENCKEVDIVIHLAGKAHDTSNISDPEEYFKINAGLTEKVFRYFLKSTATRFIFFSSVKAVADSVGNSVLTETAVPDPKTPYGKSKLEAERIILSDLRSHESSDEISVRGKKVYILRPCMIHGPGNKGNMNLLYNLLKKGLPWPLGGFENKRSFCSIGNIAFVIKECIHKNIEPGIYHLADDLPLSTNELIGLIADSLDKKPCILKIPVSVIKLLAKAGDILHLPLNSERLKKLTESYVVSNNKIKAALGIKEMPVSATDGLYYTLKSFDRSSGIWH